MLAVSNDQCPSLIAANPMPGTGVAVDSTVAAPIHVNSADGAPLFVGQNHPVVALFDADGERRRHLPGESEWFTLNDLCIVESIRSRSASPSIVRMAASCLAAKLPRLNQQQLEGAFVVGRILEQVAEALVDGHRTTEKAAEVFHPPCSVLRGCERLYSDTVKSGRVWPSARDGATTRSERTKHAVPSQ